MERRKLLQEIGITPIGFNTTSEATNALNVNHLPYYGRDLIFSRPNNYSGPIMTNQLSYDMSRRKSTTTTAPATTTTTAAATTAAATTAPTTTTTAPATTTTTTAAATTAPTTTTTAPTTTTTSTTTDDELNFQYRGKYW